ncbi:MAG: hypothetical protein JXB14_05395 [Candidatus Altiarchaeota archaeon]|nr:hypothetical protein [Candidatus Altiarchaeota archaeon]
MARSDILMFSQETRECCSDLMCCILGVSSLEGRIISEIGEGDVEAMAKKVGCSRSSAQRALKGLVSLGLMEKRRVESKRGVKYTYSRIDKAEIKKVLLKELDRSYADVKSQIEKL